MRKNGNQWQSTDADRIEITISFKKGQPNFKIYDFGKWDPSLISDFFYEWCHFIQKQILNRMVAINSFSLFENLNIFEWNIFIQLFVENDETHKIQDKSFLNRNRWFRICIQKCSEKPFYSMAFHLGIQRWKLRWIRGELTKTTQKLKILLAKLNPKLFF